MAALNPVERWLWGSVIRNALTIPTTRLVREMPRIGLKAATQLQVGMFWLAPTFALVVGVWLRLAPQPLRWIGDAFLAAGLVALFFVLVRVFSHIRAAKQWRQDHDPQRDEPAC